MTPLLRKFLGMNWLLLALMLALAMFGVFAIYSATWMRDEASIQNLWHAQAIWVGVGFVTFLVTSLVDYRWIKWGALPMYVLGLGLLAFTLVHGQRIANVRSWIRVGHISFQPAQLAVVAGIMVLGLFLSQFRTLHPMLRFILSGIICGAPMLLIIVQPDLGETIIWVPVLLAMLFAGGMPLRYLICIILMIAIALPVMYFFVLKPFQQKRITAFAHPELDQQDTAYGINAALNAVGSGGWAGAGFKTPLSQIEIDSLPQTAVQNDYIFSVIANQWGFIGGVTLLGAFALLLMVCLVVAFRAADEIGLLLAVGFAGLIFTHVVQNIGMMIALLPITGVPLPLISYSGSFVLMIMFGLGVVNSVWVHRKALA